MAEDHELRDLTATLATLRDREAMESRPAALAVRVHRDNEPILVLGERAIGGRNKRHPICLDISGVSDTHFDLSVLGASKVVLRDLGSKNGTWIGDVRVREVVLSPGSRFRVGEQTVELVRVDDQQEPISLTERFGAMVGTGSAMGRMFALLRRLAEHPSTNVLIRGETGTGKELIARGLHDLSPRARGPFEVVDCTCLPATLAESMLFGHSKGAFTGATTSQKGHFEKADGGTLFLDEIGKLPLDLQPKLLRALEGREVVRLGEARKRKLNFRLISATNRDLPMLMAKGLFLEDLYYRLGGAEVDVKPLRDRGGPNLRLLADAFLQKAAAKSGAEHPPTLSPETYELMYACPWRGNVRELKHVIERAFVLSDGCNPIDPDHLRLSTQTLQVEPSEVKAMEFQARLALQLWEKYQGQPAILESITGVDQHQWVEMARMFGFRQHEPNA